MKSLPSLWLCLLLDAVGMVSYFIPAWGEWIDAVSKPLFMIKWILLSNLVPIPFGYFFSKKAFS